MSTKSATAAAAAAVIFLGLKTSTVNLLGVDLC